MRNTSAVPGSLIREMNQHFFDLSPGGVLAYVDPTIGPLHNTRKQLVVRLNPTRNRLELRVRGCITEVFDLDTDVGDACQTAFGAYFRTFEKLCDEKGSDTRAA